MTRPLILVTNDDGVLAPGLQALADALADLADVMVCAPETERSGSAHAITLHTHLRAGSVRAGCWYLVGHAGRLRLLRALAPVLNGRRRSSCSGINAGFNLGSDVLYSGTVGGAVEGYLRACSGIAVSAERSPVGPLWAAPVVRALAERVLAAGERVLLNVNVPALPGHVEVEEPARVAELAQGRELVVTRLGERRYRDGVQPRTDPLGRPYYWIGGPPEPGSTDPRARYRCCRSGAGVRDPPRARLDRARPRARARARGRARTRGSAPLSRGMKVMPAPLPATDAERLRALVRARIRDVPDFPKPGILFRDISPLLADAEALAAALDLHVDRSPIRQHERERRRQGRRHRVARLPLRHRARARASVPASCSCASRASSRTRPSRRPTRSSTARIA